MMGSFSTDMIFQFLLRFRYLLTREGEVYLVHLAQHRVENHVVVDDVHRKLIIDSEEYSLILPW